MNKVRIDADCHLCGETFPKSEIKIMFELYTCEACLYKVCGHVLPARIVA